MGQVAKSERELKLEKCLKALVSLRRFKQNLPTDDKTTEEWGWYNGQRDHLWNEADNLLSEIERWTEGDRFKEIGGGGYAGKVVSADDRFDCLAVVYDGDVAPGKVRIVRKDLVTHE